ncbi:ARM repeat-containing protein [Trametopsis cervina]|nr:ARM repeat-containing protein [Trametopsis cervina]
MSPPNPSSHLPENVSPEELYNVISAATSQDPGQIKASSDRLKQMLEMAGTFDALSEIAAQRNLPLQVRQQSIIQLKNSSLGHWKSRKLINDQQRANIRQRCTELLDEQDDVIAECNELILAKIARQEFPQAWPTLLQDLLAMIEREMATRYSGASSIPTSSIVPLRRGLEALNAILKEFIHIKMLSGIKTMSKIAEQLHLVIQNYYSGTAAVFTRLDPSTVSDIRISEDLLIAHLIFKCVVKTAIWVWPRLKASDQSSMSRLEPWVCRFNSSTQLQTINELRINLILATPSSTLSITSAETSLATLTRHIRLFGKFFRRLQQLDVQRFVALPGCNDLILYYWSKVVQATSGPANYIEDSPTALFPVRFLVQAMVLFKESLAQWAPVKKDGSENVQVLPQPFVEDAVKLLVTRFIPLHPSDLEGWMTDPEEWVNLEERDNDLWEFELRPCGERVLMTLAYQYRQYVVPLLRSSFEQIVTQRTSDLTSILQKEAMYCAIGRCATRLKGEIPFEQWLETTLVSESRERNPNTLTHPNASYPIIKRRIAWLIGKWISSECSTPNNPKVWEVLAFLLQDKSEGSDAVVRLTAAVALKECVDTLAFEIGSFLPFLPAVVNELVVLLMEADSMESKRRILGTLNTIIERAETHIVPLISMVAQPLPQLWTSAAEEWLMKGSLLETVTKLLEASKGQASTLNPLVVPLIKESFTPGAQAQLDEDALTMWQAALRNTANLDDTASGVTLFELVPLALNLLANNFDLLGKIVNIVESYVLLDDSRLLQLCAVDLFRALEKGMNIAIQMNVKDMAISIQLILQLAPSNLWGEALHVSGLFFFLIKAFQEDKLLTEYVYILARIALSDKNMFLQLVSATSSTLQIAEDQVWQAILDQWWTRFDNMSEPRHRKLTAMGIACLVSTGKHEVLERLPTEICNLWLDVFGEIREATTADDDGTSSTLWLYWDKVPETFYRGTEGTAEYARREATHENDLVKKTQLTGFIAVQLQQAEAACGGPEVLQQRYLAKADPTVLKQIYDELNGRGPGQR